MDAFLPPDLQDLVINSLDVDEEYEDEREDYRFSNTIADEIILLTQNIVSEKTAKK